MTRPLAVLRPEPGNARTAARVEASGLTAIRLPLFVVKPLGWPVPDAARFDALLVTSANAMRHGGAKLTALRRLPVLAVGEASAAAARAAGFQVEMTGEADAAALVARAKGRRLLHVTGRDRVILPGVEAVVVYVAEPVAVVDAGVLAGSVALVHSARAARRLGEVTDAGRIARGSVRIAALSGAVAQAAGTGWESVDVSPAPTDAALAALAAALAD